MTSLALFAAMAVSALSQDPNDPLKDSWKPVTLNLKDADAAGALERLSAISGESIKVWGGDPAPKRFSVQVKEGTFWSALDEICRRHGGLRHPPLWNQQKEPRIVASPWVEFPVWYRGPLRLTVSDAARLREVRGGDRLDRIEVCLILQWVRTFTPVRNREFWPGSLDLTRAEDDTGQSLLPEIEIDREFQSVPTRSSDTFHCPWLFRLKPSAAGAKSIATLEGFWTGQFLVGRKEVIFENPVDKPDAEQAVGALTVALKNFRADEKNPRMYRYTIRVSYDPATAPPAFVESLAGAPLESRVQLEARNDADGMNLLTRMRNDPAQPFADFSGLVRSEQGPLKSIRVRIAAEVGFVQVPFTLKKIPLPEVSK